MKNKDSRIILTLDAGGTNFVFSAMQGNKEIVDAITLPSNVNNLDSCLQSLVLGFQRVRKQLKKEAAAISFAFPGPADYLNGIIGDLPNFPCFRGGVALGPFLKEKFGIPVFINNDGHLFAYGEALAGILPELNLLLRQQGSSKKYNNLLGITLGTGFGGGVVLDKVLLRGDNGCGGNVWLSANKYDNGLLAEANVSIRAVKRKYKEYSGNDEELTPKEIFQIAEGNKEGNVEAAKKSFEDLGRVAGFTIAESLNIVDGIVVLGGGIAHAHKYILPSLIQEMKTTRNAITGEVFPRLQMKVYNLTLEEEIQEFIQDDTALVPIPDSARFAPYSAGKKIGVAISKLGASHAIALGAYNYALSQLDLQK